MVGTIVVISLGISLWAIIFAMLLYLVFTSEYWFIFMCILIVYFVISLVATYAIFLVAY
jgi:hypothetical protein